MSSKKAKRKSLLDSTLSQEEHLEDNGAQNEADGTNLQEEFNALELVLDDPSEDENDVNGEEEDGDEEEGDLNDFDGEGGEDEEEDNEEEEEGDEDDEEEYEEDEEDEEDEDDEDSEDFEENESFEEEDSKGKQVVKKMKPKSKEERAQLQGVPAEEETDSDSSDDEHVRNTLGRIPLEWYDDLPHLGYDLEGRKILKPAKGDALDKFLDKMENPEDWWRTVKDSLTDQDVVLTDKELELVERITSGQFPDSSYDPFEKYIDFFTGEKMIHPISETHEPKRRFVPSKWEAKKVVKLIRAIRKGYIKSKDEIVQKPRFYNLWDQEVDQRHRPFSLTAPKIALPQHNESYNPPSEYLFTKEQEKQWHNTDPEDRKTNFVPQKFKSLREVPGYNKFVNERFERCLDLYLCPRIKKNRLNINPDKLLPKLPNPKDLQPFPTILSIVYEGHTEKIRTLSIDPTGQWVITGSDDKTCRIWEIQTSRCISVINTPDIVLKVAWNPNKMVSLVAIASGNDVIIINPMVAHESIIASTDRGIKEGFNSSKQDKSLEWIKPSEEEFEKGFRCILKHRSEVNYVIWHRKGDYFASVCPQGQSKSVFIHQLTKHASQNPFKKNAGFIQCVQFHPTKPIFFVATQKFIRVYNLLQQQLSKKLQSGVKWISSLDIHPKGDNLIIGSYDKRVCWFDMDLSTKPYRVLRYHAFAVRRTVYHRKFPLFASCSDDGTIQIFHGMVYNDLLQNPLIVPLKILRGHKVVDDYGVLDCEFHPFQPWIMSCGADNTLRLYT